MSRPWAILEKDAALEKRTVLGKDTVLAKEPVRRGVAQLLLLTFTTASLLMPLPQCFGGSNAWAQEPDRPSVGIVPFARKGEVGVIAAGRIEEYLRQMLTASDIVRPLPAKVIDSGKPLSPIVKEAKEKPLSPALKAFERADTLAVTARTDVEENQDPAETLKLLKAASQKYEDNFAELVDFTKLVDVYAQAAAVSLKLNDAKGAKDWLEKAVVLQPTFVVDTRKASKPLQQALATAKKSLGEKEGANLTIDCGAAGADVFVDGVRIGNCPSQINDLLQGTHYVQVRKPGALPWGQTFVAKGKDGSISANLKVEEDTSSIGMSVPPEDVKAYAGSGNFHEKVFKNMAAMFSKQVGAQYLLYGVVTRNPRNLELHMFLFQAKNKRVCALDKVEYQPTFGDAQMKTLDAEGRVRAALTTCKEVTDLPPVYDASMEAKAEAAAAVVPVAPPPTIDEVQPLPKPEPKPEPKIRPAPTVGPAYDANADPYAGLLHDEDETQAKPWYKKWWPWAIGGVLVAGGVAAIVYAATRQAPATTSFSAVGIVP